MKQATIPWRAAVIASQRQAAKRQALPPISDTGSYPYYLKTRIASKRGHLCNDESAETLVRLLQAGCKKFALCHISQENNAPSQVLESVRTELLKHTVIPEADCIVQPARRHEISPIIEF